MSPFGAASIRSHTKKSGVRRSGNNGDRSLGKADAASFRSIVLDSISMRPILRYFTHQVKHFRYITHRPPCHVYADPHTPNRPSRDSPNAVPFPFEFRDAPLRYFTHRLPRFDPHKSHFDTSPTTPPTSMVYTPFFDALHTKFRWFTHRPFPIRPRTQQLAKGYPQRNSLITQVFNNLTDNQKDLWITCDDDSNRMAQS